MGLLSEQYRKKTSSYQNSYGELLHTMDSLKSRCALFNAIKCTFSTPAVLDCSMVSLVTLGTAFRRLAPMEVLG